jgi:hypothetical protein
MLNDRNFKLRYATWIDVKTGHKIVGFVRLYDNGDIEIASSNEMIKSYGKPLSSSVSHFEIGE